MSKCSDYAEVTQLRAADPGAVAKAVRPCAATAA
jgi:hypothetical protein